jgi:hypothetical protein
MTNGANDGLADPSAFPHQFRNGLDKKRSEHGRNRPKPEKSTKVTYPPAHNGLVAGDSCPPAGNRDFNQARLFLDHQRLWTA